MRSFVEFPGGIHLRRGAQWRFALEILRQMPRTAIPCDVISCSAAMSACEKAAEWQLAVALFEDMFRLKLQVETGKDGRWHEGG